MQVCGIGEVTICSHCCIAMDTVVPHPLYATLFSAHLSRCYFNMFTHFGAGRLVLSYGVFSMRLFPCMYIVDDVLISVTLVTVGKTTLFQQCLATVDVQEITAEAIAV